MAGLYQQTFKQRPTIKLAPDAVVHLNDDPLINICPICEAKVAVSDYITTITTSLANNSTVGTANFTISIPKHGHQGNYLVRGGRVFGIHLMDEIEIYIKARYPYDNKGNRDYFKVFWGVVTNIQESYSDGYQNISVSCESILKWLQMMNTNESPSNSVALDTGRNTLVQLLTGKSYGNRNVYEIIYDMVNICYKNMVVPDTLQSDVTNAATGTTRRTTIHPRDIELMNYWRKRFAYVKSSLKMFGASPEAFLEAPKVTGDPDVVAYKPSESIITPIVIQYNSKALLDFKPYAKMDQKVLSIIHNSYKNNLEIINEVKLLSGMEFYLDTNGDIVFKPPFWNLDTKKNTVYRVEDTDIISWDFSEDANQVFTRLEVTGSILQQFDVNAEIKIGASFTDWNLARQFGIKSEQISINYFTTKEMCYYHAVSELDRINANRYSASISIIGRPEIRLGYPIYIVSRDMYAYVDNISHNFSFGGQFTTQLELSGIRRKYIGDSTFAAKLNFKGENTRSFGLNGKPAILLYEGNSDDIFNELGLTTKKQQEDYIKKTPDLLDKLRKIALANDNQEYHKSNNYGKYVEYGLEDQEAQRVLKIADGAKLKNDQDSYLNFLEKAIPVSDESGYELIGCFENGRSFELTNSNILKKKGKSFSDILYNVQTGRDETSNASRVQPSMYNINMDNRPLPDTPPRDNTPDNTDKSIAEFTKIKSASLRDLSPIGKDLKVCQCYDKAMTDNIRSDLVKVDGKKVMSQSSISSNVRGVK